MEFFFKPKGIALIGATPNETKGGNAILKNLIIGFKKNIYPVNPRYDEIEGLKCYKSVSEVPDPVDMAISFVPAGLVPQAVRECAHRGIKGVMIESGGFAESGPDGQDLQKELKDLVKETGIRLWGPNCMGLVDPKRGYVFSFVSPLIWETGMMKGDVSLVVQSGMLSGGFLIDTMTHGTMGVAKVCSIGNKVDVNETELLEYFITDPDTKAIGMYLESIPDGRKFIDLCRSCPKPIVILKGGKSDQGAKAALSHTASLAGNGALISGLLAQAGVVEANDFKQMMDLCRALAAYPQPPAPIPGRVAVLTYSGGGGIVSADFMDRMDLKLADLSQESKDQIQTVFPPWMPLGNPVDLWPAVEQHGGQKVYETAAKAVCRDDNVDAILLQTFAGGFALTVDYKAMAEAAREAGKPIINWLLGSSEDAKKNHLQAQAEGVPVYRELYRALECLNAVFARKIRTPEEPALLLDRSAYADWEDILEKQSGPLDEYRSKQILGGLGLPTVEEALAGTKEEALELAARFGFPVVMKGLAPSMVHKTEQGLVRLGLSCERDVEENFRDLKNILPADGRVLIQRQIKGDMELILGYVRDPQFGPCVMCGLGGILAEALGQAVFASAPLSEGDGLDLLDRLPAQKILNGFRGAQPADRAALAEILCRLGQLGADNPRIKEIDLNPVIVAQGKPAAVDASIILKD